MKATSQKLWPFFRDLALHLKLFKLHVHFERRLKNVNFAQTDLLLNLKGITPKFDATIVLRYDRASLNVMCWMNGKRLTLRISNTNASSSFTRCISADELQRIQKKPLSSAPTSGKRHKFCNKTSPKRHLKLEPNVVRPTQWIIRIKDKMMQLANEETSLPVPEKRLTMNAEHMQLRDSLRKLSASAWLCAS